MELRLGLYPVSRGIESRLLLKLQVRAAASFNSGKKMPVNLQEKRLTRDSHFPHIQAAQVM